MTTSTRGANAGKTMARFLGNSLRSPEEKHAIRRNLKGYQIEIFTSLVNDEWEAWAQIRVAREGQETNTLNLLTLGYKTKHAAQEEIWEEAKRKIAEVSNRNS